MYVLLLTITNNRSNDIMQTGVIIPPYHPLDVIIPPIDERCLYANRSIVLELYGYIRSQIGAQFVIEPS